MITNKNSLSVLSPACIGVMLISLAGIVLPLVVAFELAENRQPVSNFTQAYFSFREALQNNTGDEFTGEATAWLFGASSVPVGVDLFSRTVIRYVPIGGTVKSIIRHMNNLQRKYLMPLHIYLSIVALGLGILHLTLSSCTANPFPELGLILTSILVTTGMFFKWRAVPANIRKNLYKFHSSLIVSGVLLIVLFTGHAVMGLD
jgi:FtsH-binding integral membrane protein